MDKLDQVTSEIITSEQCVELDSVIDTFDKWQMVIADLTKTKTEFTEEMKTVKLDKERLERKNTELEKNVSDLQGMVDTLHKQLHTMCDLEDTIRKGHLQIKCKTKELSDARSETFSQKVKHDELVEKIKESHSEEINKLTKEMIAEKNTELGKLRELIEQKNDEIHQLQQQLDESYAEKESEILKMSMDYESKLTKLKQKTAATPTQSSSANQEIFRKKLQHLKTEYERELNHLKYTVSDLQEKLATQGNMGRVTVSSCKKRRI